MKLNVEPLLHLMDNKVLGYGPKTRFINELLGDEFGLTCVSAGLNRLGYGPTKVESLVCTQKKKSGKRLDGWVSAGNRLFQVEVKSWNSNSLQFETFPRNNPERASDCRKKNWSIVCQGGLSDAEVVNEHLQKVLIPMRPPSNCVHLQILPLVCVWFPLHPEGKSEPLFSAKLKATGKEFPELWFFSVSDFLSSVPETWDIALPQVEEKIGLLRSIVGAF